MATRAADAHGRHGRTAPAAADARRGHRPGRVRPRAARRAHRASAPACYCVVAVHSTALGPALGGLRIWHYPDPDDALRDAMRLAAGMTLKAAAAGLDLGGGKGVICAPAEGLEGERRRAALLDFGDLVESLDGRYITAEDVGTTPADLVAVSRADLAPHRAAARARRLRRPEPVHGDRGRGGDPRLRARALRRRRARRAQRLRRRARPRRRRARPAAAPTRLRADRLRHRSGQARAGRRARRALGRARRGDARPGATCSCRARSGERSPTTTSTCSAARSSAARPTTSSPTTRSPRRWPSAGSSTRPTSSPTRAA